MKCLLATATPAAYCVFVVFIETPTFTKHAERLLGDDETARLLVELMHRPDQGSIIRGSGGLRKLRWAAKGHGKRSGVRVIYYWVTAEAQIYLLLAYPKNEKEDLNADEVKLLRLLVESWLP